MLPERIPAMDNAQITACVYTHTHIHVYIKLSTLITLTGVLFWCSFIFPYSILNITSTGD